MSSHFNAVCGQDSPGSLAGSLNDLFKQVICPLCHSSTNVEEVEPDLFKCFSCNLLFEDLP